MVEHYKDISLFQKGPSGGYVKQMRGYNTSELRRNDPTAFMLLSLISERTRWNHKTVDTRGLEVGQSFVGDFKEAGIPTERQYRTALKHLREYGMIETKATNKGTIVTLLNTSIFDPFTDREDGSSLPDSYSTGIEDHHWDVIRKSYPNNATTVFSVWYALLRTSRQKQSKIFKLSDSILGDLCGLHRNSISKIRQQLADIGLLSWKSEMTAYAGREPVTYNLEPEKNSHSEKTYTLKQLRGAFIAGKKSVEV